MRTIAPSTHASITHTYIHTYIHTHTYIHAYTHTYISAHVLSYVGHAYTPHQSTYVHTHLHARDQNTQANVHTCTCHCICYKVAHIPAKFGTSRVSLHFRAYFCTLEHARASQRCLLTLCRWLFAGKQAPRLLAKRKFRAKSQKFSREISEALRQKQTASRQISEAFAQKKQQLCANLNKPPAKTLIWTHNDNKIVVTCKRRCDGFDHDCYVERVCVCVHIHTHTVEQRVGVGLERELRNFSISAQDWNKKYKFVTAVAAYI